MFLFVKQIIWKYKKHLATGELIKRMLSDAPIQNDSDNEVCFEILIHRMGLDLDRNVGWFYLGDAFYAFTYYFIEFILYVFLCLSDRDHALAGCQRVTTYNIEFSWLKI